MTFLFLQFDRRKVAHNALQDEFLFGFHLILAIPVLLMCQTRQICLGCAGPAHTGFVSIKVLIGHVKARHPTSSYELQSVAITILRGVLAMA